jgi:hypothetical protein
MLETETVVSGELYDHTAGIDWGEGGLGAKDDPGLFNPFEYLSNHEISQEIDESLSLPVLQVTGDAEPIPNQILSGQESRFPITSLPYHHSPRDSRSGYHDPL